MGAESAVGAPVRDIQLPECELGLGSVIVSPEAPELIAGVRIEPFQVYPDDRGWFLELARLGRGLVASFPANTTQVSAALSYPGTIKAFHYHLLQTDCWSPVAGMLQVALVDLRPDSASFGVKNTMYVGTMRPWRILVPPGVGHGYKVIGSDPAVLVYLTDRFYNKDDEGRIPHNDPRINYDWETQHK